MVEFSLVSEEGTESITAQRGEMLKLPRINLKNSTFLGWNIYNTLNYGYMNIPAESDAEIYAVSTKGPAYLLESYFRGVPQDNLDKRSHFRRYVVDVYLENSNAQSGEFRLENVNHILYYLGNIPEADTVIEVTAETNQRGGAYNGVAFFSTSYITVKWQSKKPADSSVKRRKIASLMLCFGKWGMSQREIEKRTSDEIIIPDCNFNAVADDKPALVSANFFSGIVIEEEEADKNPAKLTVKREDELFSYDFGEVISRFAVMADSHIGERYGWQNYDWLYGVFNHLEAIHKNTPLDFVLQLGDNIDDGYAASYKKDYDLYLEVIKKLAICDPLNPIEGRGEGKIPHYELQGNHDTSFDTRFFRNKLWFSENAKGEKVAFIGFFTKYGGYPAVNFAVAPTDSYKSYGILTDDMTEFVEESILKAKDKGAKHIVLCNHFGIAQDLPSPILPESGLGKIDSICSKNNIRLYLNGHEHNKDYTLRSYGEMYDYDAAMTRDKYSVFEIYEKCAKVTIYNTFDNSIDRIDIIEL